MDPARLEELAKRPRTIRLDVVLIAIWTAFWLSAFAWTFTDRSLAQQGEG